VHGDESGQHVVGTPGGLAVYVLYDFLGGAGERLGPSPRTQFKDAAAAAPAPCRMLHTLVNYPRDATTSYRGSSALYFVLATVRFASKTAYMWLSKTTA